MALPEKTITLTVTTDQLRAIDHGISAELRELAQQPRTADKTLLSSLWDMQAQIDRLLTAKETEFRAYDAAHQQRGMCGG